MRSSVDIVSLWKAARKHDHEVVKKLLVQLGEANALSMVNVSHPRYGTTPLMAACTKRETEHKHPTRSAAQTVALLLEFGADPSIRACDREGGTALHAAAACNQVRSVEILIGAGVDPYVLNSRGHSALDVARMHRSVDVADVLTQLLRLYSGWLYVRTTKIHMHDPGAKHTMLRIWKKRWAVALAGDANQSVVELALYKDRDDLRPHRVVLLRGDTHTLVATPKTKWLDRHNMFHAERPLIVQKTRARRFSRAAPTSESERLEFAAETAAQQAAWIGLLRCRRRDDHPNQHEPPVPIVIIEPNEMTNDSPAELFGSPQPTTMPLSPLGGGDVPPSTITVSSEQITATQNVFVSPRHREEPSAPSFVSSMDDLSISELSFYEQVTPTTIPSAPVADDHVPRRQECVICMDAPRDAICVPCGHVAGCHVCLTRHVQVHEVCPICRSSVQTVVKIYEC